MFSYQKRERAQGILVAFLVVLFGMITAQVGAQDVPDFSGGLAFKFFGSNPCTSLIWIPAKLLTWDGGTTAEEIDDGTTAIADIQGMVCAPFGQGSEALLWNPNEIYTWGSGPAAAEVTDGGSSIAGVRGAAFEVFGSTPVDGLFWNSDMLFQWDGGTFASEVTDGGNSIADIQGVSFEAFGTIPPDALIWTQDKLLNWDGGLFVSEITDAGNSISGIQGIVFKPFGTLSEALIWTASALYCWSGGTFATEVLDGGSSIADIQAIAFQSFGDTADALIWTPAKIVQWDGGSSVDEITSGGSSIPDVKGVVLASFGALPQRALIWTSSKLYRWYDGVEASEVTVGGSAVSNVKGAAFESFGAVPCEALVWTSSKVLHWSSGTAGTEILIGGNSVSDVRGLIFQSFGDTSDAVMWTHDRVLTWDGGSTVSEILFVGNSIQDVQGIVSKPYGSMPCECLFFAPTKVYMWDGSLDAYEVLENGTTSIYCYDPNDTKIVESVVHHADESYSKSSGAGVLGTPAKSHIHYSGSPGAAANVPSATPATNHTTIVGAAPSVNASLIFDPGQVSGTISGNAMRLFGFRDTLGIGNEDESGLQFMELSVRTLPNPLSSSTSIHYALAKDSDVRLEIIDMAGRRVTVLVEQRQKAGRKKVYWDGIDCNGFAVPEGIYFCRLQAGSRSVVAKIVVMR